LAIAAVLGARTLPHAKVGDVDPLSAVIALGGIAAGIAVGVWTGSLSLRARLRLRQCRRRDKRPLHRIGRGSFPSRHVGRREHRREA
jgi:hypothetical protein